MSKVHGRRRRTIAVLLALMAAVTLFAASPAAASSFVFRAGTACPFDIQIEATAQAQDGAPGHQISHQVVSGNITITNLETGATYLWFSRYNDTETFDPATKTYHVTVEGRTIFLPATGDSGPSGVVGESGALYGMSGTMEYTVTKQGVITDFSFTGSYVDICAELSE